MKHILCTVVVCIATIVSKSQPLHQPPTSTDTTHYYYDTTKTLLWYVSNLVTGASQTNMGYKVTKSKMDFVQPSQDELKKDSFTVHKNKVAVGSIYFVPIEFLDSIETKKQKRNIYKLEYSVLPIDLLLYDFNKNFDALLKNTQKTVAVIADTSKTKVKIVNTKNSNKKP